MKYIIPKYFILLIPLLFLLFNKTVIAQDTTESLAFKKNKPVLRKGGFYYRPDPSYQILQQYKLIKEANAGDPFAQHELGLRYLLGEGMVADTLKGAYWLSKAAENNLVAAKYNYAILLINGWGTEWNPYLAYKYFYDAAESGMPAAQHIVGLLYTDNLIVKRNLSKAYYWIKKAVEEDYDPAKESIQKIKKYLSDSELKELKNIDDKSYEKNDIGSSGNQFGEENEDVTSGLVFIDFDAMQDTIKQIDDKQIIDDLTTAANENLSDSISFNNIKTISNIADSIDLSLLLKLADYGSPEALTFLGRLYEKGEVYEKNLLTAASYFVRASRLNSNKATILLWDMLQNKDIENMLLKEIDRENPEAMYVYAGLYLLGLGDELVEKDIFDLLIRSVKKGYLPAFIELGSVYFSDNLNTGNKEKAILLWQEAEQKGSKEASVRIASANIYELIYPDKIKSSIKKLIIASEYGSILAQFTLAYAYENGIGVNKDKAKTVKYLRIAANRGSRTAYEELQRIYDEIRPEDERFSVN